LTLDLLNEPEWVFPFENMEVGESFFIPTLKSSDMIYAIESGAKRVGIKVKVFVTIKEDHFGVRVWRLN
jgi:hypothetical protein|tara:strand:+ start:27 stop:233 length:207 start_codon:yes stop_codon:yes gene_type:complete